MNSRTSASDRKWREELGSVGCEMVPECVLFAIQGAGLCSTNVVPRVLTFCHLYDALLLCHEATEIPHFVTTPILGSTLGQPVVRFRAVIRARGLCSWLCWWLRRATVGKGRAATTRRFQLCCLGDPLGNQSQVSGTFVMWSCYGNAIYWMINRVLWYPNIQGLLRSSA